MLDFDYLDALGLGYWLNDARPAGAKCFCNDTRKIQPGECFLAIRTDQRDGNEFLSAAEKNGAACAFVNYPQPNVHIPQFVYQDTVTVLKRFAHAVRQRFHYPVVGVTGSMGKTSTKDLLACLLGVNENKTALNENNELGILMTMSKLSPDEQHAIIEIGVDEVGYMSAHLQVVRPTAGIVTGVCRVHTDSLGGEDGIAREKCKLAEYVSNNHGICVFSEDLLRFECFKSLRHQCVVPSASPSEKVYYLVDDSDHVRKLMISIEGTRHQLSVPYDMSDGMIKNLVLSATYALLLDVSTDILQERLSHWQPSFMRGMVVKKGDRTFYADCYNANPASFKDSLSNFDRLFPHPVRLFIIGCFTRDAVGETYESENRKLGSDLPLRPGDTVIVVGDDAEAVHCGILDRDHKFVCTFDQNPADLADKVKVFTGVIYLKGHHFYHLEDLIL